jgi:HD-GYP domain-containing protein (c-di-GMP phosphodiesterase class II)
LGGSAAQLSLRFAGVSLLVVGIIGALAGVTSYSLVRTSQEKTAARDTAALVGEPVASLLDEELTGDAAALSDELRFRLQVLASALLEGDLRSLRVLDAEGAALFAAGEPPSESASSSEETVSSARLPSPDGDVFTTYIRGDNYRIEVSQDPSGVDDRIADERRLTLTILAIAIVLLFALLQAGFWSVVRILSGNHARLVRLHAAGEDLRSSLDLHDVITRLARDVTAMTGGQFGLVALYEEDTGDLLLRATFDLQSGTVSHHQRAIEEWFLRRCVATNTTIVNAQSAAMYRQYFGEALPDEGQVNVLCLPMALRDRVAGAVAVIQTSASRQSGFSATDIREAADLAGQGAMAIEQALLFAKVRSYASEVELSYDSTLKALMAALDAKDEVTEGHCERVAKLTVQLAKDMGTPETALVDIERGALLHDVGKIGVPDAVLKKPEALNDLEWEAMRRHPLLAGVMISKVGFLENATPILLYHHERFDGQGYPFGLREDQIPLEARIFSVVDSYDAMTSNRPYRPAMPHEVAMDEVRANSGTQFDPEVVLAFERLMIARPELRAQTANRRDVLHTDDVPFDDVA